MDGGHELPARMRDRPRWPGSKDELVAILQPFVEEGGKSFLRDNENATVSKATIDRDGVMMAAPIAHEIWKRDAKLTIEESTARGATQSFLNRFVQIGLR